MRVVFICFYEAYPPASGAASVTFNVTKYASGDRILIQLGTKDRREFTRDGVTVITLAGASDSKFQKIKGLFARIERIVDQLRNISPDVVVLEGASWVMYHLLLLRKIRRSFPHARIIYHSHNVEYYLRKEKHGKIITGLTFWAEKRLLKEADLSFAVSEVDSSQFEQLYGVRPELLPNGVDCEMFDRVAEEEIAALKSEYGIGDSAILFMGSYSYKPNREAIDFLLKDVMSKVLEKCKNAQLVIIGGDVPYKESWLVNPGCVPYAKVPAFVRACRIGVAPIFSGSGTRLKILEYMAAGLPVMSTGKGAEGLNVTNGKNILIADQEGNFASYILSLLSDREHASSIGDKGQKMVRRHYSWETIMKEFNRSTAIR